MAVFHRGRSDSRYLCHCLFHNPRLPFVPCQLAYTRRTSPRTSANGGGFTWPRGRSAKAGKWIWLTVFADRLQDLVVRYITIQHDCCSFIRELLSYVMCNHGLQSNHHSFAMRSSVADRDNYIFSCVKVFRVLFTFCIVFDISFSDTQIPVVIGSGISLVLWWWVS